MYPTLPAYIAPVDKNIMEMRPYAIGIFSSYSIHTALIIKLLKNSNMM